MSYNCTDIAFAPYGDYWRQLRKICTLELLSVKRVQSFRLLRRGEMLKLARSVASSAGSAFNLTEKTYDSSYSFTSRAAFGMKTKEQELFVSLVQESIQMASGFDIADVYPSVKLLQATSRTKSRLSKLQKKVDEILEGIINEHRLKRTAAGIDDSTRQDDLVDVLLRFQDEGDQLPLATDNIKAVILVRKKIELSSIPRIIIKFITRIYYKIHFFCLYQDVFTAGSETSATTVVWAMTEMLRNTGVLKQAQEEVRRVFENQGCVDESYLDQLDYLKSVIKETLRLHPPLPLLLPRECGQVCKINSYDIPLESRILINAWAIGRDPKQWDDAESFIPERFLDSSIDFRGNNFEYIPFGGGRRICPGISFGLVNVELQLAMLLYHFDWTLPQGLKPQQLAMTETFGATVRRKDDLIAVPTVNIPVPTI